MLTGLQRTHEWVMQTITHCLIEHHMSSVVCVPLLGLSASFLSPHIPEIVRLIMIMSIACVTKANEYCGQSVWISLI